MARCDQGYLCDVCGDEVAEIEHSDLYLRFIIGEVRTADLLASPERHLRCNPVQSQFIVDDAFDPVVTNGPFDKRLLDTDEVSERESLVTRGWRRLQQVRTLGLPISEYPLDEVR